MARCGISRGRVSPTQRCALLLIGMLLAAGSGFSHLLFAAGLPAATITLLSSAEVQGADIALGDIAQIEYHLEDPDGKPKQDLAGVYLGRAPLPGASRKITAATVEMRLRQAGIHPSTVAIIPPTEGAVVVTTATQTVDPDMLTGAVREHLLEKLGGSFQIGVQAAGGLPLVVPAGQLELRVESVPPGYGTYQLGVRVYVDGQWYRQVQARVQLQPLQPAGVSLAGGEAEGGFIGQDQTGQSAAGEPAAHPVENGTVREMLVKAGEPVVIEVVSGGIRVEAWGRARQSGSLGDMIRVENVDSRKIIYARVVAAGVVRLDLSSGD